MHFFRVCGRINTEKKVGEDLKLLFFDMEFANGKIPGSVFSFGYVITDEEFNILSGPTDICINPDCEWNAYVADKILAYPMETIKASPLFPDCYEQIKELFANADIAVGFSVNNDVTALKKACMRYELSPIPYFWFDMERVCRRSDKHRGAHGLAGYVTAWCGQAPENQHRSDGDALATMHLMRAICNDSHIDAEMLITAFPECAGDTIAAQNPQNRAKNAHTGSKKRRRPRRRKKKDTEKKANS